MMGHEGVSEYDRRKLRDGGNANQSDIKSSVFSYVITETLYMLHPYLLIKSFRYISC